MDLNKFGKRAYTCALKRGKIHNHTDDLSLHNETIEGLREEFNELVDADEICTSPHLEKYSEVVEELTDIAIASLTELYRRGVNIEEVLHEKMHYNEHR